MQKQTEIAEMIIRNADEPVNSFGDIGLVVEVEERDEERSKKGFKIE